MNLKKLRKDESGATAVIVAVLLVVLVGMVALVIDFGRGYTTKANMQSACDLASLAGANELAQNLANTSGARNKALEIAARNGFPNAQVTIVDGTKVRVDINQTQNNLAAGVVGVNTMQINTTATASVIGVNFTQDFPYSIFSGSDTDELKMNSGQYTVYGSIHSNSKLSFGAGYTKAKGFSAVQGGEFDYNSYQITEVGEGVYEETKITPKSQVPRANRIEMPYYLGENMEALITPPPERPDSYWTKNIAPNDLWSASSSFYSEMNKNGNFQITGSGYWSMCDTTIDHTGDLRLKLSGDTTVQSCTFFTVNGDLYIDNASKKTTLCNYNSWKGGKMVINGNVYCNGDLELANVYVNGNVYCTGKLGNNGNGFTINGTYVYANSIQTSNSVDISGTIVTEGDIKLIGNHSDVSGSADTLSIYSKNGNIDFYTAKGSGHGIIFAPKGTISYVGANEFYGKIIGDKLRLGAGSISIYPLDRNLPYDTTPSGKPKDSKMIARLIE